MKQYRVTTLSLFLTAVMAVAIVGCGGEPATTTDEPAPSKDLRENLQGAVQSEPSRSATEPVAAEEPAGSATEEPAAGEALTATTIVGSSWDVMGGMMKLTFEADGVLKVGTDDGESTGEWSIDGTSLTVIAGDAEYEATIDGDKLTYQGMPLTRLQ